MAIIAKKYPNTGESIQAGGMSGGLTGTTAIAVSGIIEVADVTGSGAWIAFGASGMSAPSADAANAYFIPPFGVTRPFIVSDSYTHIRGSAKINVRSLDVA
jgi:hypothetical protein